MKQTIVIKVYMYCYKCRSKALKIAVSIQGVESVKLAGEDKDQVVVVGDGIDSVELTRQLRKKVAHAELLSVTENGGKQTPKPDLPPPPLPVIGFPPPPCYAYPHYHDCGEREPPCTIL